MVSTSAPGPSAFSSPAVTKKITRWLHDHLFNTWYNTIMTFGAVWLIYKAVTGLFSWGVLNASFGSTPEPCKAVDGACWNFIGDMWPLYMVGPYPFEERWRPYLALAILLGLTVLVLVPRMRTWKPLPFVWISSTFLYFYLVQGSGWALTLVLIVAVVAVLSMSSWFRGLSFRTQTLTLIASVLTVPWIGTRLIDLGPVETNLWGGLMLTLLLSVVGIVVSFPFGVILALGRRSRKMPVIRALSVGYIELIRGVPLITILFMASVMIPLFFPAGWELNKLLRAAIGITLFSSAYLAETVRGGLQALPKGQEEAAQALGLNYFQLMVLIILPQALRIVIPPMVGGFIALLKDTSLVSIIGLFDLLAIASLSTANPIWIGKIVEAYVFIGAIYWAICFGMAHYSKVLERKFKAGQF